MAEAIDWLKPASLWTGNGLDYRQPDFFQPQLLGFNSDTFVEEFLAAVAKPNSDELKKFAATPPRPNEPLKLFQPVHGTFYLVAGSLCCRLPGFPDRVVRTADGENTFFVLRKLIGGLEYGWVPDGLQKGWQPLNGGGKTILDNEQRLPLHNVQAGSGRCIVFGYIPVASRETYNVKPADVPKLAGDPSATLSDARVDELQSIFVDGLAQLKPGHLVTTTNAPANISLTLSVYLLLDLWEYLAKPEVLPDVATALRNGSSSPVFRGAQSTAKDDLWSWMQAQTLSGSLKLGSALTQVAAKQSELEKAGGVEPISLGFDHNYDAQGWSLDTASLNNKVQAALSPAAQPPVELPKVEPRSDALYVIRFVYERPQCDPPQSIVSRRSEKFSFAPYFDPDAPARAIKIPTPGDVSIAGLRKFKKGVSIMVSEAMQKKIDQLNGNERKLLKDPPEIGPEGSGGLALICSFSIQIIFIVALFLLLMFVIILNIAFWWIMFFRICLPIPKKLLKGVT